MKTKNKDLPNKGILLLLLVLLTSLIGNYVQARLRTEENTVVRVVDGDSIDLKDGRRIRLLGLDAPEKDRCLYSEARERLKQLVLDKKVTLKNKVTDDYGRILADVFVGNNYINKLMLIDGLARFTYASGEYYNDLKSVALKSKVLKLGVYSSLCRTTSINESCRIKANNNHGKKYYFTPNCRAYDQVIVDESYGDKWFCSEKEAFDSGFLKAKNC